MSPETLRLRPGDLRSVCVRSFFLQTLWNFQRMQNMGWLFAFWPVLRRLYPSVDERRPVALAHLEYFNTHPYLANLILGVTAGLEEDLVGGQAVRREQIHAAKKLMSGPLAALGDTLFWATLRPLLGVGAVALGLLFRHKSWLWVFVFFLGLYNVAHLVVRVGGLWIGYRLKAQVISFLMRLNLQLWARYAYRLGVGMALVAIVSMCATFGPGWFVAVLCAAVSVGFLRFGGSSTQLFYLIFGISVLGALLGRF